MSFTSLKICWRAVNFISLFIISFKKFKQPFTKLDIDLQKIVKFPQVLVDRTLPPFSWTSICLHVNNILQLSMYHWIQWYIESCKMLHWIQWYIESCKMLLTWKKIDVQEKGGRDLPTSIFYTCEITLINILS